MYSKWSFSESQTLKQRFYPFSVGTVCVRVCVFTCLSGTHMGECLILIGVYYIFFVLLMPLASGGALYIQIQNLRNTGFST